MDKCSISINFLLSFPRIPHSKKYNNPNLSKSLSSWNSVVLRKAFLMWEFFKRLFLLKYVFRILSDFGHGPLGDTDLQFKPVMRPNSCFVKQAPFPLKLNSITCRSLHITCLRSKWCVMDELKRIFFMENSVPKQLFLNIARHDSDFLHFSWFFFFDAPFLEETAALEEIFFLEEYGFNIFQMSSMTNIIGDFDEMVIVVLIKFGYLRVLYVAPFFYKKYHNWIYVSNSWKYNIKFKIWLTI